MPESSKLNDPWLVAAWPGIGSVAVGAAAYLAEQLQATLVHELPGGEYFDANHVEVEQGVAQFAPLPRSMFLEWKGDGANHDLLIFIGEAQPSSSGYALCRAIIDYAVQRGVSRVFTFAAMATQLHPSARPHVFGVATERRLLAELREFEVKILEGGQIGGLNGLLLAAGDERGLPGVSLLGELPFFAAGIPNPKASMAALRVFARLAGVDIDFTELQEASRNVETATLELLKRMKEAARRQRQALEEAEEGSVPDFAADLDEGEPDVAEPQIKLNERDRARLERLFDRARQDRDVAFELKEELDRLGAFGEYEDRFLDLFRRGE